MRRAHAIRPFSGLPPLVVVSCLLMTACDDPLRSTAPEPTPRFAISDGAHGGDTHFYFLPPLVAAPTYAGTFDGTRSPAVQICALSGGVCAADIVSFSGADVKVDPELEAYQVAWRTKGAGLDPTVTYRIEVHDGGLLLGYADLLILPAGTKSKDVDNTRFVTLKQDGMLLIQFRIEQRDRQAVFATISTGANHTCALNDQGVAYCWGSDESGELGDGGPLQSSQVPVEVAPGTGLRFTAITVGISHTCALISDGRAYCWGFNQFGEVGDGTTSNHNLPTEVAPSAGLRFNSISAGGFHTCAITVDVRQVYCWGSNEFGQLGRGTGTVGGYATDPAPIDAFPGWDLVTAGLDHTCALSDDFAYCWGSNGWGQLGDPNRPERDPEVALIPHLYTSLSAGAHNTCGAVRDSDVVACWGPAFQPQLSFAEGIGILAISTAIQHSCAITGDNVAHCWGQNTNGEVGDGTTTPRIDPVPVAPGQDLRFATISAAIQAHTCGLTTDGKAWCWGTNEFGQLGDGTTTERLLPTAVIAP